MRLGELEVDRRRRGRLHRRERRRHPAAGTRHSGVAARAADGRDPERTEGARAAGAGALRIAAGAAARRADQPPRPRVDSLAARVPRALRRRAHRHLARSALPQLGVHAHRRHRLPDDHHLHRRLRRDGDGEDADSQPGRSAERAAREEDRAAERLHRALLGRHAIEPGAVAPQGSRAAADDRARALEHPAPVHQVRDESAVRPDGARVQPGGEELRRSHGDRRVQRRRQSRRQDRHRRPQRRRQDDAAQGADVGRARIGRRHRATSTRARRAGVTRRRSATSRRTMPGRSRRA